MPPWSKLGLGFTSIQPSWNEPNWTHKLSRLHLILMSVIWTHWIWSEIQKYICIYMLHSPPTVPSAARKRAPVRELYLRKARMPAPAKEHPTTAILSTSVIWATLNNPDGYREERKKKTTQQFITVYNALYGLMWIRIGSTYYYTVYNKRGGKTTSGNGQAWSSAGSRGQWRTGKNGENWLRNHLWYPNDPRG